MVFPPSFPRCSFPRCDYKSSRMPWRHSLENTDSWAPAQCYSVRFSGIWPRNLNIWHISLWVCCMPKFENSDYNLQSWRALFDKAPMMVIVRISSRVFNTVSEKHTIGAKDCPSWTLESRQLFCLMGQSQVPLCPFRYWPLGRDIRKWRTLLTLRTNSGSLPGLCGFLYPFHQLCGIAASRVHSAFKDKRTSTFSNKSSFLMPMASDASFWAHKPFQELWNCTIVNSL